MKLTDARFVGSSTRVSQKPGQRLPEFAFIGRSNVGKSSLINMLTSRKKLAMTSSTPGKTKLVNHFIVNNSWYLVDLPGYGYAQMSQKGREELKNVIDDFILNSKDLVVLFVLIDSRHDITAIDLSFINRLGEEGIPFGLILTKCDKQGPNVLASQIEKDKEILRQYWDELPQIFTSSAQTSMGREEILDYIEKVLLQYQRENE